MTPYWLFGLPFDIATLEQVRGRIFAAVDTREQLIFATPNANFLAQVDGNSRFREDVLSAKLSLADGMPVVWLGRLMGVPIKERIAGSDLLESLIAEPGPKVLRTFFFGGEAGAAEAAMQAVNKRGSGLLVVGARYPGFVGVEQMSDAATIDEINRSNADLLVVALGAAKGHRWIEANRHRITVPVISHLGAAINFAAGRLKRAPRILQRAGLEWLWRIKEEPALFRRYAGDGWFLAKLFSGFVIPEAAGRLFRGHYPSSMEVTRSDDGVAISVTRRFGAQEVNALRDSGLQDQIDAGAPLRMAMNGITQLDALGVGWLYAARYRSAATHPAAFTSDAVSTATLKRWRADFLA